MRTKRTVVILISGKAGSGKSTVADILQKKLDELDLSVFRYAFADPIKFISKSFIGWNGQKDEKGRTLLQELGITGRNYDEDIWVKHLLQQMDKQAGMFPWNFVIVDDWRFINEYSYLKENPLLDIINLRMFGRGGLNGETSLHVSERSLPEVATEHLEAPVWEVGETDTYEVYYDYQIENTGDLETLEKKVDTILTSISKQYIVE